MKYTGTHFGLLFLTSQELEPEDFLNELTFTVKMTQLFAPWDEAIAIDVIKKDGIKDICKTAELANITVENLRRKYTLYTQN